MVRHLKQAAPLSQQASLVERVRDILAEIEQHRDEAVRRYAKQFDGWEKPHFRVPDAEIDAARRAMSAVFMEDFAFCKKQVTDFAKRQRDSLQEFEAEFGDGIILGQKIVPVETVGCYIPGGKYPLISAAIMSVATAKVAGVSHVTGAAPPRDGHGIYGPTLYALAESGADEIYCIGGVQAFAAMAYGCIGMRPVDMITGPGNAYVAEAKRQLFWQVGIDLPAGPTEILVIADETADPSLVATDLLGQAEHGPDSPAWLVTTSERLGKAVLAEIDRQLIALPTADIAGRSWARLGEVAVVEDDDATREMMARTLANDGWNVREAANGRFALDRLREATPDLILLDLMMPEMDGFEVIAHLRANDAWRPIPVVVVTAKDMTPEDHLRLQGNVRRVFRKASFAREDLVSEIRAAVQPRPVSGGMETRVS